MFDYYDSTYYLVLKYKISASAILEPPVKTHLP